MSQRCATIADAEAIARLHIASWQAAYRGVLSDEFLDSQDLAARTDAWRHKLSSPDLTVILADTPAGLLGFCACGPSHDHDAGTTAPWEIYNLHVTPLHRGRGIGSHLFDAAVSLGRGRGAHDLTLWVVDQNAPARRFYEHKGMKLDGACQSRTVGPGAALSEVRYRAPLRASISGSDRGLTSA